MSASVNSIIVTYSRPHDLILELGLILVSWGFGFILFLKLELN